MIVVPTQKKTKEALSGRCHHNSEGHGTAQAVPAESKRFICERRIKLHTGKILN